MSASTRGHRTVHDLAVEQAIGCIMDARSAADLVSDDVSRMLNALEAISVDQVADAIRRAGCEVDKVDQRGVVRLRGTSQGAEFQVLFGREVAVEKHLDLQLTCGLSVQDGRLPDDAVWEWQRTRRFVRVARTGALIVLDMDVVVAGGVHAAHLNYMIQLWTRMLREFVNFLRSYR